ncbi:MAG: hypothetical protein RIS76_3199 [Verrucomicrobiota bacterium]|jgi:hypothetical protein
MGLDLSAVTPKDGFELLHAGQLSEVAGEVELLVPISRGKFHLRTVIVDEGQLPNRIL